MSFMNYITLYVIYKLHYKSYYIISLQIILYGAREGAVSITMVTILAIIIDID